MKTQTTPQEVVRRRAKDEASKDRLIVDYYRVRRKLAYPLPIAGLHVAGFPLRSFPSADYPWSIWLTWSLEERLAALGWAAEWDGNEAISTAVARDLAVLATWPRYRQFERLDLAMGHSGRMLWRAKAHWHWPAPELQDALVQAMVRLVEDALPFSEGLHGPFKTAAQIIESHEPHAHLHNIPTIATLGAALAAHGAGHPSADLLDARLEVLVGALLEMRTRGHSEGVSYDGYLFDFIADWLSCLPEERRRPILGHPGFKSVFGESCNLYAPGDAAAVAELGDVEPAQMNFHLSAQAKLQALDPTPGRAWFLGRCAAEAMRSDGLAALHRAPSTPQEPLPGGATDAQYAAVLRGGHDDDDLAVAVSASGSPMGHIHFDRGSIVIGTRGRWLITDPGYQQYVETTERTFTIGATAHNAPTLDGRAQDRKASARPVLTSPGRGTFRADLELGECYSEAAAKISRSVWLEGKRNVIVRDRFTVGRRMELGYHWLADAGAGWWIEGGSACLAWDFAPGDCLWIRTSHGPLSERLVDRLPGSRGGMTLSYSFTVEPGSYEIAWWFQLASSLPEPRQRLQDLEP